MKNKKLEKEANLHIEDGIEALTKLVSLWKARCEQDGELTDKQKQEMKVLRDWKEEYQIRSNELSERLKEEDEKENRKT